MKGCLVVLGLVMVVGFVYFNHVQSQMLTPPPVPPPPSTATGPAGPVGGDRDLEALARELQAQESVFVAVTPESSRAFDEAVRANPDATIFTLGVSLEDRLLSVEVTSPDGTSRSRVDALIVYTDEAHLPSETPFRTDTPLGMLEYVAGHPRLQHVVLNPSSLSPGAAPPATVLGPDEIAGLRERWR